MDNEYLMMFKFLERVPALDQVRLVEQQQVYSTPRLRLEEGDTCALVWLSVSSYATPCIETMYLISFKHIAR